ncbi:MAG: DUF305 domain-containing protein [Gemmatimonadetes bacterium]|nr:DUF305 domain-containing protein [Gemmatimonadota bacterium]
MLTRTVAPLLLAVGACARGATTLDLSPIPVPAVVSTPEAIARARADSAQLPWTAADVEFMTGMIGHHAQAIAMSRLAPRNGASQSIRVLAARIINAQGDEIRLMRQWLGDRQLPVPEPDPRGMKHEMGGQSMMMLMPGMLTEAQMLELTAARGRDFDRLFLQYMIQHHQGAVGMVKTLFATDGAGQNQTVFKFASDVNVDQTTEIARMQRMLADLVLGSGK